MQIPSEILHVYELIEKGSLSDVDDYLAKHPTAILNREYGGDSVLHTAKSAEMIRLLIERGADPNATNHSGRTALYHAACEGNVDIAKALIAGGTNVNAVDNHGVTPLYEAANSRNPDTHEVARALIDAGADVDLNIAVCLGDVAEVARRLGTDPNAVAHAKFPHALVAEAVSTGVSIIVRLLLEHGADPNASPPLAPSPLIKAIMFSANNREEYNDIVRLLLEHNADPYVSFPPLGNSLAWAKDCQLNAIVSLLSSHCPSP